jgi:hypothetical protein
MSLAAVICNSVYQLGLRRNADEPLSDELRVSIARCSSLQFWRDPGYEQEDENLQKVRIWVTLFGRVRGVPTRG